MALGLKVFKSITANLNYCLNIGSTYIASYMLVEVQMLKHENSTYVIYDNMVCFPKSSHILSSTMYVAREPLCMNKYFSGCM